MRNKYLSVPKWKWILTKKYICKSWLFKISSNISTRNLSLLNSEWVPILWFHLVQMDYFKIENCSHFRVNFSNVSVYARLSNFLNFIFLDSIYRVQNILLVPNCLESIGQVLLLSLDHETQFKTFQKLCVIFSVFNYAFWLFRNCKQRFHWVFGFDAFSFF